MTVTMHMPRIGLGTWCLLGEQATDVVTQAIELGYRHIDTAPRYDNEAAVGAGIIQSGVKRSELFLTTKIWHDQLSPVAMERSAATSLENLQMDYVDLLLIHWPSTDSNWNMAASLEALVKIQQQGWAKHIGVANFTVPLLQQAWGIVGEQLAVNQVEYHISLQQKAVLGFTQSHNMMLTAYCPLARGDLSQFPVLQTIADKYGVTAHQVALAWLLQQDQVAVIPKASSCEHLHNNLQAAQLQLDAHDVALINALPKNIRTIHPDFSPAWDV
ncbi:aldo/keto reductase [Vitreoscilla stercoraria]|uniref:Aldo/keto reductase n=1 Tax=Vitreoscilla stercoraria TaxID=61 RepID=A0ABY4EAK3_VITST|nr:aldo/keto reductase [Vitreoscilla stercoraria]UOO92420.1 aldo/keto reductase [Vitreoscilla stercoraria]